MSSDLSAQFFERSKQVSPGGVHSPVRAFKGVGGVPRFMRSAKGAFLKDVDGNRYIDFCMAWGPLIFGHQDPEVSEAVQSALTRGWSFGTAEPYSLELAEFMVREIKGLERVRFVNSGTEAVMSALRVARAATGRTKILKFEGCYHGHVDSLLVKAGSGLAEMASPDSAGVSEDVARTTISIPLDDFDALDRVMNSHGHEIAAVIVEPIPANNGLLIPRSDFLSYLAKLTKNADALLIFDEVITGFRVSFGGMAERSGIVPDLFCYGKVIGGGFPVGAYGGRKDLMDLVAPSGPVYQAGTLSANPVAMTAGITMLRKLKRENPYSRLEIRTESLSREIERRMTWMESAGIRVKVQNAASLFWMVFHDSKSSCAPVRSVSQVPAPQKESYAKIFHQLLAKGIYLAPSGYEVSFLSTAHGDTEINALLDALGT